MVRVHALHGRVAGGFKVTDGFHRLEDFAHLCDTGGQNILGVAICIGLVPSFLKHILETPFLHVCFIELFFCVSQLRPLDQDVRFQSIEVNDLILPLGPEVSREYR